ncbi:hypothetical protein CDAR_503401 [Caerostris darwini]|uniref:Uncharacterized protein n=1 Tax=Caerostris darwini TaxID=1538125 RepID=A0AAV4P0J1_9ARAC|nr:hypothetical protein CDAR_503331 [Caerostris darwini]GIX89302.1 hypothetical protein CDAR_503401 [Caerostris darwini]
MKKAKICNEGKPECPFNHSTEAMGTSWFMAYKIFPFCLIMMLYRFIQGFISFLTLLWSDFCWPAFPSRRLLGCLWPIDKFLPAQIEWNCLGLEATVR